MATADTRLGDIELDEVVLLGTHPQHPTCELLVLGTTGEEDTWSSAVGLADVFLAQQRLDPAQIGLVIVDARHDVVRAARMLRRRRRNQDQDGD